uniref:Mitochondrial ribosomal protein L35 n=1 Tax=Rattus norvegicus TaxID=10116 RepID=A0ABK0LMD2_RAT
MAASIFMGAVRAASGILRPLNVSVSSTYRNCARNACLSSALRTIPFRHIQTSVVSSAPRLVKSVGHLAYGHTASVLNRVATLVPSVLKPPVRALTYCSARKGKRKTVKSVVHRFLRLHSGLWLRRKELSLDLGFPSSSRLDKVSGSSCQYPPVPHCRLMLQHQAFTRTLGIQTQFPYL